MFVLGQIELEHPVTAMRSIVLTSSTYLYLCHPVFIKYILTFVLEGFFVRFEFSVLNLTMGLCH